MSESEHTKRKMLTVLGLSVFLVIIVIFTPIAFWVWWSNNKCLNKSEELVVSGHLYDARQELKKCGWFLAGKKQKVNEELQSAINELINRAGHLAESKDFQKAKECLKNAAGAAENSSEVEGLIKKYDLLEQQWNEELARQKEELARQKIEQERIEQEKQRILSEKALNAKNEFQKALEQSLANKIDAKAKDTIEIAKNKAETAENLYGQKQFESAEKQWLSATEECRKALEAVEEAKTNRTAALALELKCNQAAESASKMNAATEAAEIWQEAEKIHNSAEQNFAQNNLDAAGQLWEQAANKYDEARQTVMQSPGYKKALLIQNKWLPLKQGLREEDVRNMLGNPKCIQAASDHCIWYYQRTPTASKIDEASYSCFLPQCGYVRFETLSIDISIERNKEDYQTYTDAEQISHENFLAGADKQIQDENSFHREECIRIETSRIDPSLRVRNGSRFYKHSGDRYYIFQTWRDREIALEEENKRHNAQLQLINNSIAQENKRHPAQLEKLAKDLQTKIDNLVSGLSPRELHYIVSDWKLPDQNDVVCLLKSEETKEHRIMPPHKWQMPVKWKSLRLNIKEDEAFAILGSPNKTLSEPGKTTYCYGKMAEYGSLIFEECTDSFRRLKYWKEPLWDHVAQELKNENQLSDPNQNVVPEEPKAEKISSIVSP